MHNVEISFLNGNTEDYYCNYRNSFSLKIRSQTSVFDMKPRYLNQFLLMQNSWKKLILNLNF